MLAFRDAVIRELKERFGVRAIAQAPPTCDSASASMVDNAIKQIKEKVRTLLIATRGLHGAVMDPEHVALAWCVCVLLVRSFPVVHSIVHFSVRLTHESCLQHGEKRARRRFRAGAESERRSHCGALQSAQDSGHGESYGPDTWIALRHVTQLLGLGCSGERWTLV